MRKIISRLLSNKLLGRIDYYRFPQARNTWGGPFNGQQFRVKIFKELLGAFEFDFIVETGTFKGATTQFMATTSNLPVYSTELHQRNFGFATQRLHHNKNVHLVLSDSRKFIKDLALKSDLTTKTVMFYLDAHWNNDLPLAEELELIFKYWKKTIILIDDFQVPDDADYNYDDYGVDKALTLDYLKKFTSHDFDVFFPVLKAKDETGARRGLAVLSCDVNFSEILDTLKTVRAYSGEDNRPE